MDIEKALKNQGSKFREDIVWEGGLPPFFAFTPPPKEKAML